MQQNDIVQELEFNKNYLKDNNDVSSIKFIREALEYILSLIILGVRGIIEEAIYYLKKAESATNKKDRMRYKKNAIESINDALEIVSRA